MFIKSIILRVSPTNPALSRTSERLSRHVEPTIFHRGTLAKLLSSPFAFPSSLRPPRQLRDKRERSAVLLRETMLRRALCYSASARDAGRTLTPLGVVVDESIEDAGKNRNHEACCRCTRAHVPGILDRDERNCGIKPCGGS